MFTENYYIWRRMVTTGTTSSTSHGPQASKNLFFVTPKGTQVGGETNFTFNHTEAYKGSPFYCMALPTCGTAPTGDKNQSWGYGGTWFGKGRTLATRNDYKLEEPIESGLSIERPSRTTYVEEAGGVIRYMVSYVVTNTGAESVEIGEIGIYSDVGTYGSSTVTSYPVLAERTVLETPITLAPGESKIVNYVISFTETQI